MSFPPVCRLSLRRLSAVFSAGSSRNRSSSARMRLVQFSPREAERSVRVGLELTEAQGVIDLKAFDPSMPSTMREFLELGQKGMDCAKRALSSGQNVLQWSDIKLLSPVTAPEKVEDEALSYVAGFTVANDVSARDWQMKRNGKQWLLGKTFDSFCPLGPALVTTETLKDVHKLGIRCLVNGVTVQDSNTSQMIFQTEKLVAWVSKFMTLSPGDVFLTGTPPGVGVFRNPPVFLKRGDVVECQIDEIGSIRNTVV
ncbi:hypothetical protein DNTS_027869 [Danionella cerebrum]|uniref:Fumarylacetoacetase-like C-terminal domain-containing protein n=1 Tax=Danionella cerebrum TaxID=2873325 RepID=A0A553MQM4_9TELE|nr:hypothetical protein DNTS_027869 [Danionella translucida]